MKNELIVKGKQDFMGKEIPIIEGGFGENCRIITAKDIANIHNIETREVNQSLNRMIGKDRLKEKIDYIDMIKDENSKSLAVTLNLIGSNRTKNVFILSERGYCKLIKYMDDDESWNIMDKLVDEYFTMREVIKCQDSYTIQDPIERAKRWIQEQEEKIALENKIKQDAPLVSLAENRIDIKGCISITDATKMFELKRGKITRWAKNKGYLHKTLTEVNKLGEKYFKVYSNDNIHNQIGVKDKGIELIRQNLDEIKNV